MFCASCGSQIPEDSRFCGNCGALVNQPFMPVSGETPGTPSVGTGPASTGPTAPSRAQYVPPGAPYPPPPPKQDRTTMWIAISAAIVILAAAGTAIPLLLRDKGSEDTSPTTAQVTTLTTSAPTTTAGTEPPTTAPPTTSAVTTVTTAALADDWVATDIPGGPWSATDIAVSDQVLLLNEPLASGTRLNAIMLDTGNVIQLAEGPGLWGIDIDGDVAVWWEGANWDDATSMWTSQHVYSFKLPDGPRTEIIDGSGLNIGFPQVALPWVAWVEGQPWPPSPDEYWAERIWLRNVNNSGVPSGAPIETVPLATAFAMGDSTWQYSLSNLMLAWENGTVAAGYPEGTQVLEIELGDQGSIGTNAWRPSLWRTTLVFSQDGHLEYTDLASGGVHDFADDGDFATAGPDFAAYYRMTYSDTEIVVKKYDRSYEKVLGTSPDPPWFSAPISVSANYIGFLTGTEPHLFRWDQPTT